MYVFWQVLCVLFLSAVAEGTASHRATLTLTWKVNCVLSSFLCLFKAARPTGSTSPLRSRQHKTCFLKQTFCLVTTVCNIEASVSLLCCSLVFCKLRTKRHVANLHKETHMCTLFTHCSITINYHYCYSTHPVLLFQRGVSWTLLKCSQVISRVDKDWDGMCWCHRGHCWCHRGHRHTPCLHPHRDTIHISLQSETHQY